MLKQSFSHNQPFIAARTRHQAGDLLGARDAYRKILKQQPQNTEALYWLATAELEISDYKAARKLLEKALKLAPKQPQIHVQLGMTYQLERKLTEAREHIDRGLALDPDLPFALQRSADLKRIEGDYASAYEITKALLDRGECDLGIVLTFSQVCHKAGKIDEGIAALKDIIQIEDLQPSLRAAALLRIGTLLDRKGEYAEAFDAFSRGNALKAARHFPDRYSAWIDDLIETWTADRHTKLPRSGLPTESPVFIVGMPRSGTSLVEQIIASHPKAVGGGERHELAQLSRNLFPGDDAVPWETHLDKLRRPALDKGAREALLSLQKIARSESRITDKMPQNFLNVGLIDLAFPNARIIHCTRDPMDTCLSCFMQDLSPVHGYACNLEHLGRYQLDTDRMMKHWKTVLKKDILEVRYEELVADQETQSRRLIDFLGLEWDEHCLRFHENTLVTVTLSSEQVRQPMYSSSVGRHKKYADQLAPLRAALGDLAEEPHA